MARKIFDSVEFQKFWREHNIWTFEFEHKMICYYLSDLSDLFIKCSLIWLCFGTLNYVWVSLFSSYCCCCFIIINVSVGEGGEGSVFTFTFEVLYSFFCSLRKDCSYFIWRFQSLPLKPLLPLLKESAPPSLKHFWRPLQQQPPPPLSWESSCIPSLENKKYIKESKLKTERKKLKYPITNKFVNAD